jgi:NAD(P)-dependent dehydrogenase (short-subunit alcohol dehydrogenase family)
MWRFPAVVVNVRVMELQGAVSIVTGAASGLGEAVADRLAAAGSHVVVVDVDDARGAKVAERIGGSFAHADVASESDVIAAIELAQAHGPIRVLVAAAGISRPKRTIGRDGSFASAHPLDLYEAVLRVNLVGVFNCVRLVATAMSTTEPVDEDGQRGAIVTIASVAAFEGQVGQVAYSASKGGIVGMTLPVARDLAVVGIRLNCIAPGLFDTPIYGTGPEAEGLKDHLRHDVLFPKRLGRTPEVASIVYSTITNDYMNAEVIRVDGGVRLQAR